MTDADAKAYFDTPGPIAFAHRGGAATGDNVGIENTLAAFGDAVARGYRYLETDVRCSADGTVYTLHDETLARVTGNRTRVAELTDSQLAAERLDGREPPAKLEDVFASFERARVNIDVKEPQAIEPTCALLERLDAVDRTCLASFSVDILTAIRERLPQVATSAASREVAFFKLTPLMLLRRMKFGPDCLQVPARYGPIAVITRRFVAKAHALGLPVHVWTVDEPNEVERLLDLGVDGIITDRTDVVRKVLTQRGEWN